MANPRRPVRIANCSGAQMDPGWQMQRQVAKGNVDFVTGDWLAENNLAQEAEAMAQDPELGFKKNTWDALQRSMDDIARTGIKVIVNGGGLNPASLARRCQELIEQRGHRLQVAFVSGDDVLAQTKAKVVKQAGLPKYFHDDVLESKHDWVNVNVNPLLACNAYIGARGIVKGLTHGADIIICGRVADASPVVAAAWWWHGWKEDDYDRLAGALIAGHLIECSAYITGANFSGFSRYPLATFVDCGYPIAEVCEDGTCVITKPEGTNGLVNKDTVTCQFLYELQGSVYLNSDVKAILDHVEIRDIGPNRVDVRGILGRPPPPTTKLAIFFKGGVETQLLMNASGYATEKKFALFEMQIRFRLEQARLADAFDVLEFQVVGTPLPDPLYQLQSTTYCRVYVQAATVGPIFSLLKIVSDETMQHFSGLHASQTGVTPPRPFFVYYPSLIPQQELQESVTLLAKTGSSHCYQCDMPTKFEELEQRPSYDPIMSRCLHEFGPASMLQLGSIVLGRSGDKGPNLNCGLFVENASIWEWFRSYMTLGTFRNLIGRDWRDEYRLERVEFPNIYAVHFVIYGFLGRGVSSSTLLDSRGKGFVDYIRAKHVAVPQRFREYCWADE